jgi:PAS domain-containing protein
VSQSIYELQVYLAITALMAWLIAALRAEQERALRLSDAWRIRYEAAAAASGQAVFDIDARSGRIAWAGDVERILGVPVSRIGTIDDIVGHLDNTARAKLRLLFDALRASASEAQTSTITWIDGASASQVEFVARSMADFDGTVYRIAGVARVVGSGAARR